MRLVNHIHCLSSFAGMLREKCTAKLKYVLLKCTYMYWDLTKKNSGHTDFASSIVFEIIKIISSDSLISVGRPETMNVLGTKVVVVLRARLL